MLLIYICLLKVRNIVNPCVDIEQLIVLWAGNVLTLIKLWEYLQFNNCYIDAPFLQTD